MLTGRILFIVTVLLIISGCTSSFTSITATDKPHIYFVTETHQSPFRVKGRLYECEAEEKTKMLCKKVR